MRKTHDFVMLPGIQQEFTPSHDLHDLLYTNPDMSHLQSKQLLTPLLQVTEPSVALLLLHILH